MKTIFGRKPVLEAIRSGKEIEKIYIQFGIKGDSVSELYKLAKKNNINLVQVSTNKFRKYEELGNTQGVVAFLPLIKYTSFSDLVEQVKTKPCSILLILDSILDTHNLGAIIRSAECVGVDGIILPKHNSAPINETVYKTSAGAVNYTKISYVPNLVAAVKSLKDFGFFIIGTDGDADRCYTDIDYSGKIAIVVGNEEKGIRRLVKEEVDFLVKIPMNGKIESLNVSVASGVILYKALEMQSKNSTLIV